MISKSSFIRGMQCQKSLWLHFNQPNERDEISQSQQQIFDTGHNVGFLAQQLFPGGVDASRDEHEKIQEALAYTALLIDNGQNVIYEAAFSDGETLCYMDILVKEADGWAAYEVKASTQVKDYQVKDVAFQYYVINRSGLPLKRISLVHVNNQSVRHGELDFQQLFTIEPMTDRILPIQKDIPGALFSLQKMLKAGVIPDIAMGPQCKKPFSCDFLDFCRQSLTVAEEEGVKDLKLNKNKDCKELYLKYQLDQLKGLQQQLSGNPGEEEPGLLHETEYFWKQAHWLQSRFPNGSYYDVEGLCKVVTQSDIAAKDWSLSPGRCVGVDAAIGDGVDYEERLPEIHIELEGLNDEAIALAKMISENFKGMIL